MKEDWRQLKWKDFSKEQKLWFVVVGVELVAIICMALVFPCFGVEIPNWAAALMLIPMIIPVYKLIQVCPWSMYYDTDEEEISEDQ